MDCYSHCFQFVDFFTPIDISWIVVFLVRNIIGADPKSGAVQINAVPRVGQTLQYQLRDSRVASDELKRLLRDCDR